MASSQVFPWLHSPREYLANCQLRRGGRKGGREEGEREGGREGGEKKAHCIQWNLRIMARWDQAFCPLKRGYPLFGG